MDCMCPAGHLFKTSTTNFINKKRRCRICKYEKISIKSSHTIEFIRIEFQKRGFTLKQEKYSNRHDKLNVECDKGHLIQVSYASISRGRGCYSCRKLNKEVEVRKIFEKLLLKSFPKSRPEWLVNPNSGRLLELDGYCKELGIAFEYDGEFHFKESRVSKYMNLDCKKQEIRDSIKNVLCEENTVLLIRINYTVENLEEYIKEKLISYKKDAIIPYDR